MTIAALKSFAPANPSRRKQVLIDPIMDEPAGFLQNPYWLFEEYRKRSPVCWSPRGNQWIVTGMEEANQLLRDNSFGKKMELWKHPNPAMRWFFRFMRSRNVGNLLFQDPPQHTRVRALIQGAFSPSIVRALDSHIAGITAGLLEKTNSQDQGDIIAQLAFPLPVTVIAELLGVPSEDQEQFKEWSTQITKSLRGQVCPYTAVKSYQASRKLRHYLQGIIKTKKDSPAADLLSTLANVQSQEDGRLSQDELLANSVLVLVAGHETTVNLIGNGVYHLLRHPAQKKLLLENPHLIENAVEEFLRFDPPVQIVRRVAYKEVTVAGKTIRPGDAVTVLLGACNRDPRVFERPDEFDIERPRIKNLSFGGGIHYCLGAELARSEARIAVNELLRKFPDIKLQRDELSYKAPFALRGLKELPVIY